MKVAVGGDRFEHSHMVYVNPKAPGMSGVHDHDFTIGIYMHRFFSNRKL